MNSCEGIVGNLADWCAWLACDGWGHILSYCILLLCQEYTHTHREEVGQNWESTVVSGRLSWYPGAAGIPPGGEVGRGSQEQLLSTLSLRVSMLQAGKGKAEPRINRIQPG